MPEPSMPPPEKIEATAREVLAGSDYSLGTFSESELTLYKLIYKIFDKLLSPVNEAGEELMNYSPALYYTLITILILALTGLLIHIVYSIYAAYSRKQFRGYRVARNTTSNNPADLEKKARNEAHNGNFIGALRMLFRGSLLRLEGGKLRRAATNREYLRRFSKTEAAAPLKIFVDIIDIKWYGGGDCTQTDWDTGLEAHKRLCRIAEKNQSRQQSKNNHTHI